MGVFLAVPSLAALVAPGGGGVTLSDSYDAGRHLPWSTIFGNTFDPTANELEIGAGHGGTGDSAEMVTTALNTDQQDVTEEFALSVDNTTNCSALVIARKDPTLATETYYRAGLVNSDSGVYRIQKVVAGVPSNLGASHTGSVWVVDVFHTLHLVVTGAGTTALELFLDGASIISTTDASSPITGNKYVGHEVNAVSPTYLRCNNFVGADH